jgi:hypothetical protein
MEKSPEGPNGRFFVGVDHLQNLEHAWTELKTLWRCPGADPLSLRLELVMCKSGELRTTHPDYRRAFPDTCRPVTRPMVRGLPEEPSEMP